MGPEQSERGGDARNVDRSAATSASYKSARWLGLSALAAGVTLGLAQPLFEVVFGGVGVFAGPSFVGLFFMLCLALMILAGLAAAVAPAGRWATVPIVVLSGWLALGMVAGNLIAGGFRVGHAAPRPSASPQVATGPAWSASGDMVTARRDHSATLLHDGRVLVAGGLDRATGRPLASAELYRPTGRWTSAGSMGQRRFDHTATVLAGGQVLMAGGWSGSPQSDDLPPLTSAELYDPSGDRWRPTGAMAGGRANAATTLLSDGRVLVVGGSPSDQTIQRYDPATKTWKSEGKLDGFLNREAILLRDGRVLVLDGFTGDLQFIDPDGLTRAHDPVRTYHGTGASMTQLSDGPLLIAGGAEVFKREWSTSTQLYDPSVPGR